MSKIGDIIYGTVLWLALLSGVAYLILDFIAKV